MLLFSLVELHVRRLAPRGGSQSPLLVTGSLCQRGERSAAHLGWQLCLGCLGGLRLSPPGPEWDHLQHRRAVMISELPSH